jgi:hypothetical protein
MNSPALFAVEVDTATGKDLQVLFVSYPSVDNIQARWDYLTQTANNPTGFNHWSGNVRKSAAQSAYAKGNRIDIRFGSAPFNK